MRVGTLIQQAGRQWLKTTVFGRSTVKACVLRREELREQQWEERRECRQ